MSGFARKDNRSQPLTRTSVFDFGKKRQTFVNNNQQPRSDINNNNFDSSSSHNFTNSRADYLQHSQVRLKIMPLKRSSTIDACPIKTCRCGESTCSSRSSHRQAFSFNPRQTPLNCSSCVCSLSCHSQVTAPQPESILVNIKDRRYPTSFRATNRFYEALLENKETTIKRTSLERNIYTNPNRKTTTTTTTNEMSILKKLDEEIARDLDRGQVEVEEELLSREIRYTLNSLRRPHSAFQIDNSNDEDFSSKSLLSGHTKNTRTYRHPTSSSTQKPTIQTFIENAKNVSLLYSQRTGIYFLEQALKKNSKC